MVSAQPIVRSYRRDGMLGSYSISYLSGTMAAGLSGASEIFQFRWATKPKVASAIIHSVTLDGLAGSATAFAAGFANIDLVAARAWTGVGSGGNALTLTTNNAKLRTTMATTLVNDMRGASTAALTAGTKTFDAQALGQFPFSTGTVVSVIYVPQPVALFDERAALQPFVLQENEGFSVRATVPGTGTWQFGLTVKWSELPVF